MPLRRAAIAPASGDLLGAGARSLVGQRRLVFRYEESEAPGWTGKIISEQKP
jgi:hypothetical protein